MRNRARNTMTQTRRASGASSRTNTTRRRLTLVEWGAIAAITVAILAVTVTSAPGELAPSADTTTVRVRENQTLWQIAEDCSPDGVPTAATVDQIREINGLQASALSAGQVLEIPAGASDSEVALDWR